MLNDEHFSVQPALRLPTRSELPARYPAVDYELRLSLDYEVPVQIRQGHVGQWIVLIITCILPSNWLCSGSREPCVI